MGKPGPQKYYYMKYEKFYRSKISRYMVYFKEQVLHCDLQLLLSCLYIVNLVICVQGIHTRLWIYNRKQCILKLQLEN